MGVDIRGGCEKNMAHRSHGQNFLTRDLCLVVKGLLDCI